MGPGSSWVRDLCWKGNPRVSCSRGTWNALSDPLDCRIFHFGWRPNTLGSKVPPGWVVCSHFLMVICKIKKCINFLTSPVCFRLSFATYLTTIILFIFVIGTGGWFMLTTGLIMILASFSYAIIIISDPPLVFPFADALGHVVRLSPRFGWSWYLNLITGVVVVLLAIIILLMNHFFPRKIAVVFHHSVVEEDEFLLVCFQIIYNIKIFTCIID